MDPIEHIAAARQTLLDEVETFLSERGVSASAFGKLVANDSHLVKRLRNGENMTTGLLTRIQHYLRAMKNASEAA